MNKETVKKPLMRKPIFWISTVVGVFVFLLVVGLLVEDEPEVYVPGSNQTSERQQNQPSVQVDEPPIQPEQPLVQSEHLDVQLEQPNVPIVNGEPISGFDISTTPDGLSYFCMFENNIYNGFGVVIMPETEAGTIIFSGFFGDGNTSGPYSMTIHGESNFNGVVMMEDWNVQEIMYKFEDETEYAAFETEYEGIVYLGAVLAGTQIPHGSGIYHDRIYQDWHVGYFNYGLPIGYGIQASSARGEWFLGTWDGGFLDTVDSYGGNADPNHIYGLTTWPGILPKPVYEVNEPGAPPTATGSSPSTSGSPSTATGSIGLILVSHPPAEFDECNGCGGAGTIICSFCGGSDSHNNLPPELTQMPGGMFNIGLSLMSANCINCGNSRRIRCPLACGDGKSFNKSAAFIAYVENLALLSETTGMNVFEVAPGHANRFISVQKCVHCNGVPVSGQTVCLSCVYGYHINFPNDPNDRFIPPPANFQIIGSNPYEGLVNYYRDSISANAARRNNSPWHTAESSGNCVNCGERGYPMCSSCKAGRSAVNLGATNTGNCIRCRGTTYGTSAYCGACD